MDIRELVFLAYWEVREERKKTEADWPTLEYVPEVIP